MNRNTVERYMEAYGRMDHAAVLALLTDDVEWIIPGHVELKGKAAFDREMANGEAGGTPAITVTRLIESDGVVVAEGRVRVALKAGGEFNLVISVTFESRSGLISKLTS